MLRTNALRRAIAAITFFTAVPLLGLAPNANAASTASVTVSGSVFDDADRDGVRDAVEPGLAGHGLYLFDTTGSLVGTTTTASNGAYQFAGIAPGDYQLTSSYDSWQSLKQGWVPTTTGSLQPEQVVHATTSTTADLGWRRIVRSTQVGSPISSMTGPSGLRVESYNDVVTAAQLHDVLATGTIGAEAPNVTVRFDLGDNDITTVSSGGSSSGGPTFYAAYAYVSYSSWLSQGPVTLSHEYGHAWSLYNGYVVQQDPNMAAYLAARGLTGDPRLDTSHAWNVTELVAEDYRQLLGVPSARSASQENADIPPAAQVEGLLTYLRDTFTTAPSSGGGTSPTSTTPAEIRSLVVNPSPVRTTGTASFELTAPGTLTVEVRTAKGALVRRLASGSTASSGSHSMVWDRTNDRGRKVGKGAYSVVVTLVDASGRTISSSVPFNVV